MSRWRCMDLSQCMLIQSVRRLWCSIFEADETGLAESCNASSIFIAWLSSYSSPQCSPASVNSVVENFNNQRVLTWSHNSSSFNFDWRSPYRSVRSLPRRLSRCRRNNITIGFLLQIINLSLSLPPLFPFSLSSSLSLSHSLLIAPQAEGPFRS